MDAKQSDGPIIFKVPDRGEPNSPGEVDFKYVFQQLEKLKYDGWVGLEYKPVGKTADGLDWMDKMGLKS